MSNLNPFGYEAFAKGRWRQIHHVPVFLSAFLSLTLPAHAGGLSGLLGGTVKTVTTPVTNLTNTVTGTVNALPVVGGTVNHVTAPVINTVNTVTTPSGGKISTIDPIGDGLTSVAVDKTTAGTLATKPLSARGADELVRNAINLKGVEQARSVQLRNGVIVLGAPAAAPKIAKTKQQAKPTPPVAENNKIDDKSVDKANRLYQVLTAGNVGKPAEESAWVDRISDEPLPIKWQGMTN